VQGAWTYDEGWTSEAGDVVFEVAGSTHSPRMVGKEETIVFAVIEGALNFLDDAGNTVAVENWQTFLKRYHGYCSEKGITPGGYHKILTLSFKRRKLHLLFRLQFQAVLVLFQKCSQPVCSVKQTRPLLVIQRHRKPSKPVNTYAAFLADAKLQRPAAL
jgi:hypothetical protein